MKKFLLPMLIIISGCTSVEFVRKDTHPRKQAVVRFAPPSSPKKEAEYREEVKKQATQFCGGDFTITKEYQARENGGSSTGISTGFGFGMGGGGILIGGANQNTAMYNFVEFDCKLQ